MANRLMHTCNQTNPFSVQIAPNNNAGQSCWVTDEDYLAMMPPGFRFRPTDEELITEYLLKKIKNEQLPPNMIHVVRLYGFSPDYLAQTFKGVGENEWYFFTPRDKKYRNGKRPRRDAGEGFWKASIAGQSIFRNGVEIGKRRTLSYFKGRQPGEKTPWKMNEYYIENLQPRAQTSDNNMRLDYWVLCRIHKKVNSNNSPLTDNNINEQGQNAIVALEEGVRNEVEVQNVDPLAVDYSWFSNQQAGMGSDYNYNIPTSVDMAIQGNQSATESTSYQYLSSTPGEEFACVPADHSNEIPRSQEGELCGIAGASDYPQLHLSPTDEEFDEILKLEVNENWDFDDILGDEAPDGWPQPNQRLMQHPAAGLDPIKD